MVRSQGEAQANMAEKISKFASSQEKWWKESIEEKKKHDEMFLKFKKDDAEKNREHEL